MSTHVDGEFRPTTVSHNLDVFWRINQVARRADAITEWALENMGSNMSNGNSLFTTANISNLSVLLNTPSALYALMNASRLSNMSNLLGVVNASNLAAFSNLAHFFTDDGSNLARLNYLLNSLNTSFLFDQTLASNLTALAASASNVINGSSAGTWSSNATAIIASNASFSSNAVSLLTGNMNLSTMSNFSNIFSASNLSNLSYLMSNDDCAKGYCKQMSNALASISNVIAGGNGFLNQITNLSNLSNLIMNPDVWTLLYGQPSNLAGALSNFSNIDTSRCKWTSNALASISNLTSQTQGGAFLNIMSNLSNLAFLMSNVNSASTLLSAANMSNIQLLVRDSNAAIDAMNCCKAASNALGSNLSNVILASSNGGFMNNVQVLSNLSNLLVNSNALASILAISPILSNTSVADIGDCCKWASNALAGLSNVVRAPFLAELTNLSNLSNLISSQAGAASLLINSNAYLALSNFASNALLESACCKWASNQLGTILSNLPAVVGSNDFLLNNLSNLATLSNIMTNGTFLISSNLSNLSAILSNALAASSNDCCVWASNLLNTSLSNVLATNFLNGLSNLSNLSNLTSMLSNASFLINNSNLSNFSYSITTAISVSNITNLFSILSNITNIEIDTSGASNWNWASNAIGNSEQYYAALNAALLLGQGSNGLFAQLLMNSNLTSYLQNSNAIVNLYSLVNTSNITNIFNAINTTVAIDMAGLSNWNWASNTVSGLGSNLDGLASLFASSASNLANLSNLLNNSNTAFILSASNLSNLQYILSSSNILTDIECCERTSNALGAMIDATSLGGEVDALFQASNLANLSNLLAAFYNSSNAPNSAAVYLSNLASVLSNPLESSECCAWASNAIASIATSTSSLASLLANSNALANLSNVLLSNYAATASIFNASNMSNIANLLSNYDPTCQEDWASNQASAALALLASTSNASLLIDLSALSNLSNVLGVGFSQGMFNASNLCNLAALLENYDPNECAWASNAAAKLSNLSTSSASFILNTSNLSGLFASVASNYSNAALDGAFASNLAVWTSNAFGSNSNQCKLHWSFESSNPSFTSNTTGVLPRFVYNSNNDSTWYIDCDGAAMSLRGLNSNVVPSSNGVYQTGVISFKTSSELASLSAPAVGDAYIVAPSGTRQSDIATWNGTAWDYLVPKDGDRATVMVASGTYASGIYTYNAALDLWTFVSPLPVLSNDGYASGTIIVGNVALSSQDNVMHSSGMPAPIIVDDKIAVWGRVIWFNAGDEGSSYYPRNMSFNWSSLMASTDRKSASYAPVFVDIAIQNDFALALDSRGKVWAASGSPGAVGAGLSRPLQTSNLSVELAPYCGLSPVAFFQENDVTIRKVFVGAYMGVPNAAALATNGDLYVTGANWQGVLGQGFVDLVSPSYRWVKYPIAKVKNAHVMYYNIFALTVDNKLYMTGQDTNGYMIGTGSTSQQLTPRLLMSDVRTFSVTEKHSFWIVKTDGTLWVAGWNGNGQLGLGALRPINTWQTGFVQVPGITNAVSVVPQTHIEGGGYRYACLLRSDGTISFTGQNLYGEFGYELHTTNNGTLNTSTTFVTPTAPFQGRVKSVLLGFSSSQVLTTAGELFNAGMPKQRGIGRQQTPASWGVGWWVMNSFMQVPIPDPVAGFRMYTSTGQQNGDQWDQGTEHDSTVLLTTRGRVYTYGLDVSAWNNGRGYCISPSMVPILHLTKGIPVASAPAMTI
jgi:alpha-tubulin suppressor-like RCC1 family protein